MAKAVDDGPKRSVQLQLQFSKDSYTLTNDAGAVVSKGPARSRRQDLGPYLVDAVKSEAPAPLPTDCAVGAQVGC